MNKLDKWIRVLIMLSVILMLSSCKQRDNTKNTSPNPTITGELSEDEISSTSNTVEKQNEKLFRQKEKLQHTKSYLLYDENTSSVTIEVYLKDVSSFKKYDKVVCYNNDNLVTDKVKVYTDMEDYLLKFDIEEYVEYFNRIELVSDDNSEYINIGEHFIEKIEKDTLKEKEWMILDSYEKEDQINKFKAKFSFSGNNDERYQIDLKIPHQLEKLNILKTNYTCKNNNVKFECEIPEESFEKLGLYSVEFDMAIIQSDKKNNKSYKILKSFIPLVKSYTAVQP